MRIRNLPWLGMLALAPLVELGLDGPLPYTRFETRVASVVQGCGQEREEKRERDQRVPDVFKALGIRPGAIVADIGAGQGFYTTRLAKAVGGDGKVYGVDISDSTLGTLRSRVEREGLGNVEIVKGEIDNPRLPEGSLDAALIVNAYHEMTEHQAMLEHIRRALKPDGRLVILEPISPSRRSEPRASQTSRHEIAPELVMEDARGAGFKVAALEDPFSSHGGHGSEWLMVLTPERTTETSPPERKRGCARAEPSR